MKHMIMYKVTHHYPCVDCQGIYKRFSGPDDGYSIANVEGSPYSDEKYSFNIFRNTGSYSKGHR